MKNNNLDLYKRFGLEVNIDEARTGFRKYCKNIFKKHVNGIISPELYVEEVQLEKIRQGVLDEVCRQLFWDTENYVRWKQGMDGFIDSVFVGEFSRFLFQLQILINVAFDYKFIRSDIVSFSTETEKYLSDFPMIGVMIKTYKNRPPQIFPTPSAVFEKEVKETLDAIETTKGYEETLSSYETGLKEFLFAKSKAQLKDVVEDMYTSCDMAIAAVSGNKSLGFRNLFVGKKPYNIGVNKWQLEIFNQLHDWINKIKHGVEKDYSREDVEGIILLTSMFIKVTVNK